MTAPGKHGAPHGAPVPPAGLAGFPEFFCARRTTNKESPAKAGLDSAKFDAKPLSDRCCRFAIDVASLRLSVASGPQMEMKCKASGFGLQPSASEDGCRVTVSC